MTSIDIEYLEKLTQKRECEKLKELTSKYEDEGSSSESGSEDDEAELLTEQLDKEWFKTFAAIKNKDPKIYNPETKFYTRNDEDSEQDDDDDKVKNKDKSDKKKKSKKEKPVHLKDYEREYILGKADLSNSDESDEEDDKKEKTQLGFRDAQLKEIADSFQVFLKKPDSEAEKDLFVAKEETEEDKEAKRQTYVDWLKGNEDVDDDDTKELMPLKRYWNDPNLDDGEKFLRDLILDKKYICDDDEVLNELDEPLDVDEDEKEFEREENFMNHFDLRYENPNQEFIKTYPRIIANSVRLKDNKRAEQRKKIDERKKQEKVKKKEELKLLRKLKEKEEAKKLKRLKKISGAEMKSNDLDLDGDFDASKHDQMMQKYFDQNYYAEYDEEDVTQPDEKTEKLIHSDEECVNWDEWTGEETKKNEAKKKRKNENQEVNETKSKKSKFSEILEKNRSKPSFDPKKLTFQEYLDTYYNLDFEDLIGGQSCRFKYKKVVAADYGLSAEEILNAKDQELNAYVPIKTMTACRTEEEELLFERAIKRKRLGKKKKIFKSLYEKPLDTTTESLHAASSSNIETVEAAVGEEVDKANKDISAKKKNKHSQNNNEENFGNATTIEAMTTDTTANSNGTDKKKKRVRNKKRKNNISGGVDAGTKPSTPGTAMEEAVEKNYVSIETKKPLHKKNLKRKREDNDFAISNDRLEAYNIQPKKFKYYYTPMLKQMKKEGK